MKHPSLWSSTVQGGGKRRGIVANFVPARHSETPPKQAADWVRLCIFIVCVAVPVLLRAALRL